MRYTITHDMMHFIMHNTVMHIIRSAYLPWYTDSNVQGNTHSRMEKSDACKWNPEKLYKRKRFTEDLGYRCISVPSPVADFFVYQIYLRCKTKTNTARCLRKSHLNAPVHRDQICKFTCRVKTSRLPINIQVRIPGYFVLSFFQKDDSVSL